MVLLAVVVACGDNSDASFADAQTDSASDGHGSDASDVPTCSTDIASIPAAELHGAASDGTNVFISSRSASGTFELHRVAKSGGTPMLVTTGVERLVVTASGDAVFYTSRNGGNYALHQLVAGVDTVLGSVPAGARELEIAANATDLYVLGPSNGGKTSLWRLSRSGVGNGPIPTVTQVNGTTFSLALGTTVAAFKTASDGKIQVVSLPGPSTPTSSDGGQNLSFVGDNGFWFQAGMITQNTKWASVGQFTPVSRIIFTGMQYMGSMGPIFTDERYIYVYETYGTGRSLKYWHLDGTVAGSICASASGVQDASDFFGFRQSGDEWIVSVVPKPM
jgi:hypothetical protein